MRGFTLDSFDTSPGLREDLPPPSPAEGEMLVRVHDSSVNPVDAGDEAGRSNIMAVPSPENLGRLAQQLDAGILRVHIQESYPLEQAGEALQALGVTHTQGKLGIRVEPS